MYLAHRHIFTTFVAFDKWFFVEIYDFAKLKQSKETISTEIYGWLCLTTLAMGYFFLLTFLTISDWKGIIYYAKIKTVTATRLNVIVSSVRKFSLVKNNSSFRLPERFETVNFRLQVIKKNISSTIHSSYRFVYLYNERVL